MNTNEKIAKLLGIEDELIYRSNGEIFYKEIKLDFLHDRNQQKWIEDKLIKLGYGIIYEYYLDKNPKYWFVEIFDSAYPDSESIVFKTNESKDLAFISAVEQLIDKEHQTAEKSKNNNE